MRRLSNRFRVPQASGFANVHTLSVLIVLCAAPALGANHPSVPQGNECLSCHAEKIRGQSVHYDFTRACTVCHAVTVANGETSITLVLPKEKLCYSCHEKAAMDKVSFMRGECVSCHDPHNSERRYLLRANARLPSDAGKR